ncbi:ABC-three component system protein [Kitasatospora indigofera]|uniref:ABC-three component system protein n=1 Tax=Kitasatospora indigofera TaxID=67307 RepID=UPI0033BE263C
MLDQDPLPGFEDPATVPTPPAPPALTVLAPMMKQQASLTPKQLIFFYSPDEFEEFIYEWVRALEEQYVGIDVHGGSGDHGVDVAAYRTERKLQGDWHSYQCKHYGKPLELASALPEILKVFTAAVEGHYKLPSRYVFVAPSISRGLIRTIAAPTDLKRAFLDSLAKPTNKAFVALAPDIRDTVLARAQTADFSMFRAGNLDDILDLHRTTRHWSVRFSQPLPTRPAVPQPPLEHQPSEARYLEQLLQVYCERFGASASTLDTAKDHKTAGRHLQRQREAFYSAEYLRLYARDSVPDGHFEALQKDVYDGVVEVGDRSFPLGWDRLQAVLEASGQLRLSETVLLSVVRPLDRKGVCHQLANDDLLTWCEGGDT